MSGLADGARVVSARPPALAAHHAEQAQRLLDGSSALTAEGQIAFALRAMAHMQMARLVHDNPYLLAGVPDGNIQEGRDAAPTDPGAGSPAGEGG